jgi:hypothetical protein
VHVVVAAEAKAERVLNDFKSYTTRRLRESNWIRVESGVWSRHGSTKYLRNEQQATSKVDYVANAQGAPLAPLPFIAEEHRR